MVRKLIFLMLILLVACTNQETRFLYETTDVFLGDVVVEVEIADTVEKKTFGLMEREALGEFYGMIFFFDEEMPRTFWMKNTLIPLDIIYINSEFEIVKIQEAVPCENDPCATYPSVEPTKYVVEVNMGFSKDHGIEEGMKISIEK